MKPSCPIAITGVAALYPGSKDAPGFWRTILAGEDHISEVPRSHWLRDDYYDPEPGTQDKLYTTRGGFLGEVEFDPMEFGIPPNTVPAIDTAQLLALIIGRKALADAARGNPDAFQELRTSVILGVASATELVGHMSARLGRPVWAAALREAGLSDDQVTEICDRITEKYVPWQENTFPGLLPNVVAGRIANRFDLHGTNCVVDAACASSLAALSMGLNELYLGQTDMVVTGGVDALNDILMYMCFAQSGALSRTGDCRPFDAAADGTILGEGVGMAVLRRLEDAERDGDAIYGVIRGMGSSSDGRALSIYSPRPEGQARAMRMTYEAAGYPASSVGLVEAHGTGTGAGDPAELESMHEVFCPEGAAERPRTALGSVKSQIGHTKAAAGYAGLFKVLMGVHHGVVPPTIKVQQPNPAARWDESPFYLPAEPKPWIRAAGGTPRRGAVSSFGFGGTNFHVTVEEYTGSGTRAPRLRTADHELVVVSAPGPGALAARLAELKSGELPPGTLAFLAWRTQQDFDAAASARLSVVATDEADLVKKLEQAEAMLAKGGTEGFSLPGGVHYATGPAPGPVAFVFPGQGSQRVGMGGAAAVHFEVVREVWDRLAGVDLGGDVPLSEVVFPPSRYDQEAKAADETRLSATEWAQPALGAANLAYLELLRALGVTPAFAAGNSFGELVALVAAGSLGEGDMMRLARRRGELMAAAPDEPGTMLVVKDRREIVDGHLASAGVGDDVVVANHNSPKQVVLSGTVAGIETVAEVLAGAGVATQRIPVSTAFHSPLMEPARGPFAEFLRELPVQAPTIPVFSNVMAAAYPPDPEAIRAGLTDQLVKPVRWVEEVEAMAAAGAKVFVEVGPGTVLTGLVKRILKGEDVHVVGLGSRREDGIATLMAGIGQLAALGVPLDFAALRRGEAAPEDPRQAKRPKLAVPLSGANYGKPYPVVDEAPRPVRPLETLKPPAAAPAPAPAAAPVAASAAMPAAPPAPDGAWLRAFEDHQRQTIQVHREFQQMMAQTHQTFLQGAEASLGALGGTAPVSGAGHASPGYPAASPMAPLTPMAPMAPAMPAPPAYAPPPPAAAMPAPPPPQAAAPAPPTATPPTAAPAAPALPPAAELERTILALVAEHTGYPEEMLELGMQLESDLGIDSIKRVQILSAFQDAIPGLPEMDTAKLASLRTLGEIVGAVQDAGPAEGAPATGAPAPETPAADGLPSREALEGLLLGLVAEHTGYPEEMLELGMRLESDLGIDSIKRVQILSAFQDAVPGLPELDTAKLASLQTLGEIVGALDGGGSERVAPSTVTAASTGGAAASEAAEPVAPSATDEVRRFAVRSVPAPPTGFALPGLRSCGTVHVTREGTGVAEALVAELAGRGIPAEAVDTPPIESRAVIYLGGLRPGLGSEHAEDVAGSALAIALALAPDLADAARVLVTVQDTGGDLGHGGAGARAWCGGLPGLVKTAAREWPRAGVRAIDLARGEQSPEDLARRLADELLAGGPEVEVGLAADGSRSVLLAVEEPLEAGAAAPGADSFFVVSGGARGVTATCVLELARRHQGRYLLVGRTALTEEPAAYAGVEGDAELKKVALVEARCAGETPSPRDLQRIASRILAQREIRATLAAIEAAGGQARYASLDVRDPAALGAALAPLRAEWGPVTGVVHGAGVLADAPLTKKTMEEFSRVFETKVAGLRALLAATASDPLRHLCLFTSIAGRAGNPGQADYALANETLVRVAGAEQARRGDGCRVVALDWGPWIGGMVTPALEAEFRRRGITLVPPAVGAGLFADELTGPVGSGVEVVLGGQPTLGGEEHPLRVEVHLDAGTAPYLESHVIQGVPVVPVAVAIEWFGRLAGALEPGLEVTECRDLKVFQGVTLPAWGEGPTTLALEAARQPARPGCAVYELTLLDDLGRKRKRATVELCAGFPDSGGAEADYPAPSPGEDPWPELYAAETLFHGEAFQVIQELRGLTEGAAETAVLGAGEMGWRDGPWVADPACVDGALQTSFLWSLSRTGSHYLPLEVERYVRRGSSDAPGPRRVLLRGRECTAEKAVADLLVLAADGSPLAEIHGVHSFAVSGGTA